LVEASERRIATLESGRTRWWRLPTRCGMPWTPRSRWMTGRRVWRARMHYQEDPGPIAW